MKMLSSIDIHTHILPGMDDGSKNEDESRQMLARLAEQNVVTAALTPHYYHYKESLIDFLTRRNASLQILKPISDSMGIHILPASETYLTEDLLNESDLKELCFQSTQLLLVEMPLNSIFSARDIMLLERIVSDYSITPVLAHIERYPRLLNSDELISELLEIGCLMQVNLCSMTESNAFIRKKLMHLLSDHLISFVGTDCHRMSFRPPEYTKYIDYISKKLGYGFMFRFMEDMSRMLMQT